MDTPNRNNYSRKKPANACALPKTIELQLLLSLQEEDLALEASTASNPIQSESDAISSNSQQLDLDNASSSSDQSPAWQNLINCLRNLSSEETLEKILLEEQENAENFLPLCILLDLHPNLLSTITRKALDWQRWATLEFLAIKQVEVPDLETLIKQFCTLGRHEGAHTLLSTIQPSERRDKVMRNLLTQLCTEGKYDNTHSLLSAMQPSEERDKLVDFVTERVLAQKERLDKLYRSPPDYDLQPDSRITALKCWLPEGAELAQYKSLTCSNPRKPKEIEHLEQTCCSSELLQRIQSLRR